MVAEETGGKGTRDTELQKVLNSDAWNSVIFHLVEVAEDAVPSNH